MLLRCQQKIFSLNDFARQMHWAYSGNAFKAGFARTA